MPSKNIVDFANQVKSYALGIKDQQVLGAWNFVRNNATTATVGEVTWTVYSDGTVGVSGTPTAGSFIDTGYFPLSPGKYYLGGLAEAVNVELYMSFKKNGVSLTEHYNTTVAEDTFFDWSNLDFDSANITIKRRINNVACSGVVKPMIALKPNYPYVPNAMTNRELTIQDLTSQITFDTNLFTNASSKLYVQGKFAILFLMGDVTSITAANTYQTIATLPIKPVFANVSQQFYWGTTKALAVKINTNGTVDIRIGDTSTGGTNWIIPVVIE